MTLTNLTINITYSIKEELTAMRLMIIQNRMVLDLLTAEKGGVCHIVGESCCTPENDADGHAISEGIHRLKAIAEAQAADSKENTDWFSWLTFGNWKALLIRLLTPVLIALVVLMVISCCAVPLLKRCVNDADSISMMKTPLAPHLHDNKCCLSSQKPDLFPVLTCDDDFI